MDTNHIAPRALLFPWLAYGHISPFLQLAKKLSERGFYIYLCSTPMNLNSIQKNVTKNNDSATIQLVELHLPSLPELSPHHQTTNGLPLNLIPTLVKALELAKPNLINIVEDLNPDLIIHDGLMPWLPVVASEHNIPAVRFSTSGAATTSYFRHVELCPEIEFPFPTCHLCEFGKAYVDRSVGPRRAERDPEDDQIPQISSNIMLVNSSREIEGKYMDYLSDLIKTKIIPVSPLVLNPVSDDDDGNIKLIEWLEKKNGHSTVFVSFGTEVFLQKEEIEEIAIGLELSGVNFIWVLKFPVGESIGVEKVLPDGFLARIGGRGMVVQGWVPQAKILSHPSIGGFVSHCGWNSTLESLELGIPLVAMPVQYDQFVNAKLVVEIGIGVEVMRDDNGKFRREEIGKVIKNLIVGNMAEHVRKQVRDLRRKVQIREKEEMDEAYQLLTQICENKANARISGSL